MGNVMTYSWVKLFFSLSIFIVILLAGWYPFKKRMQHDGHFDFPIGETFATGIFLGAGLLHMLPEAQEMFHQQGYVYPFAFIITGLVFLFFLWFEHLVRELYHHHENTHPAFALLAWLMLSIHSVVQGTALGLSHDFAIVIMLFLAIITHKWAESFAIAVQLNRSSLNYYYRIAFFIAFALMTPIGIGLGWYMNQGVQTNSLMDPILIAVSAGTFLYLGTLHGLERCVLVERCCNLRDFSFVIIGFLLMAAVAIYT